jgi:hypothetical protein
MEELAAVVMQDVALVGSLTALLPLLGLRGRLILVGVEQDKAAQDKQLQHKVVLV